MTQANMIPDEAVLAVLDRVMYAARGGDWILVERLTSLLQTLAVPANEGELREYQRALTETLVVAKASRGGLQMTASRLMAAAGFQPPTDS